MMFLLRTALWTSLALALLPSLVPTKSSPVAVDIGAAQALTAVSATFADLGGLCGRRPEACAAGAQFAAAFWHRTQAGAKIVYDFVGAQLANVDRTHSASAGGVGVAGAAGGAGGAGAVAGGAATGAAGDAEPGPEAATPENRIAAPDTLSAADLVPAWRGPPPRRDGKHPA
jgi:uncharacterized protein DUF5330